MREVRLSDRFDLSCPTVLLNGTQALVRLLLMQKARDLAVGLNTAGYVTGYRGSPLGSVDMQMQRAKSFLESADILFQPAVNEDLAATALWGAQQAELRGEGKYDGVFGLWYGKGPGVDRSGDALRHANMAGTSRHGGVLMALGDDHTGESSTTLHQSEWALVDAYIPILSPAGVQEILDFGLAGFALSRFSGNWVGLKCMKETVEATSVVDGRSNRMPFRVPEVDTPPGGLNIRLSDTPVEREARIIDYRRFAAEAFGRENQLDRRVWGRPGAKIGFVAAGKNWLDLVHAFELLDLDEHEVQRLGLTTYKIAMTWPLDEAGFSEWAEGLDLIVVVEEKRKLIEVQVKETIFRDRHGRRVYGWRDGHGQELFPTRYALDPFMIAERIAGVLIEEGRGTENIQASVAALQEARRTGNESSLISRLPYFCSGCPHNTSTKIPPDSRAYAGIGCHYMVQWMDRDTIGFTHMGAEGANWIGEAPFSKRGHVFQNLGDGTYAHSGLMAIRAAVNSGVNMTYKILYNDAVAMTGGQPIEGGLNPAQIAHELAAIRVQNIAVVFDEKEDLDFSAFPKGTKRCERSRLDEVQREFREKKGVSAIIYVQTCAAEKRRRRKRGKFPDPDRRVYINRSVCEGCGDCGVQSNCVSIVPVETALGRKRAIDQSSCNKDFSCLNGFCPSFVTLSNATVRKSPVETIELPELPEPVLPRIKGTHNLVVTGVGGTGVVTTGAIVAMAAYLDGLGVGMIEMAGLAQKGGAVTIHCRIADQPDDISAIRVASGEADAIIGGDLVVTAGSDQLRLAKQGRTRAAINSAETITGDFTRDTEFSLPTEKMKQRLTASIGSPNLHFVDAAALSKKLLGDSIYSNMLVFGAAWQMGAVPLTREAIEKSIELNGTAVDANKSAFAYGRWSVLHREKALALIAGRPSDFEPGDENPVEARRQHLHAYGGKRLAKRYEKFVNSIHDPDLRQSVALGYHKLLAVKDEYEVARLHLETADMAREEFDGDFSMRFHLAPPILGGTGPDGRPRKREFGPWILKAFRMLSAMRWLRNTLIDPFRYNPERRHQRKLAAQYRKDMKEAVVAYDAGRVAASLELAELPLKIRGFGPVWEANRKAAMERREELLLEMRTEARIEHKIAAE